MIPRGYGVGLENPNDPAQVRAAMERLHAECMVADARRALGERRWYRLTVDQRIAATKYFMARRSGVRS